MDQQSFLAPALQQLMMQAPIILIAIVGAIMIFSQSAKLGKAAFPAKAGITATLLLSLGSPFIQMFLVQKAAMGASQFSMKMMGIGNIFLNVLWAGSLFLIIIAVVSPRGDNS